MMDAQFDKLKLLDLIRAEHDFLMRTIAPLSDAELTQPGVMEGWSVKDILAHITVWEQRMLGWLAAETRGEAVQRPEPGWTWEQIDALNARDYEADKARSLPDVLATFHRSYAEVLATVAALSEADL
ncbi:MAG: ClbS/DfsB family four-helix bundle protein, partial [Anaerolineae bacterium]|nr:ClbS/DfsB family four-helix bundle protein [Anaerolineae bacterium]